ncbi:sensor histidine kinase [Methylobacterium aerolatum]|uniref:histidine kinase n=1 Tax=Methylobacterium aerolatum TaxID=418708 RepID=A0ABU0HZA1_9HYPH|nr:ATP-binding protein [Methylobacterium aerolatum]MDQ0447651.1 signal transduction histidine kinase [Methylobacterium aerolatum]GJD34751.1 Adaptive-response sensory-kinase SasA [Methylobacterium aerolatum]
MRIDSLRARLLALWIMLLASCAATAYLLYGLYTQSTTVQVAEAEVAATRGCRAIIDRMTGERGRRAPETSPERATALALAGLPGVEGGVWTAAKGPVAYAFPTYEGTGPKTDVPAAERSAIEEINAEALRVEHAVTLRRPSRTQVLVLQSCPLRVYAPDATAWTMLRTHVNEGPAYSRLLAGFGFLAITVVGSAVFLGRFLIGFSRRIARLEAALAAPVAETEDLPHLSATGEPELDRLVDALNAAGERLRAAHERAMGAERLAAVGRLAANLAHEVRNPIAAMRLKAENALASGDPERSATALRAVLGQIARVDALLRDLLNLTQPRSIARSPTPVSGLLRECTQLHEDFARAKGVSVAVEPGDLPGDDHPHLDRAQIARALDNLILNGIQHCPSGGRVAVAAERVVRDGALLLVLRVSDTGKGVDPALRPRIFEPFATSRPEGTGLGLAIVREIARAHRGDARLVTREGEGAAFLMELPWRPS